MFSRKDNLFENDSNNGAVAFVHMLGPVTRNPLDLSWQKATRSHSAMDSRFRGNDGREDGEVAEVTREEEGQ